MKLTWAVSAGFGLVLAGCQGMGYDKVEPGTHRIGGFDVKASTAWNRVPDHLAPGGKPTWTIDGQSLNSLTFFGRITDGAPLVPELPGPELPVFRAGMLPHDVAALVEATTARLFEGTVTRTLLLAPRPIAGQAGYLVQFEFVTQDEVIRHALAGITVHEGTLNFMLFQAPRLHYFAKDRADAEALISAARLP